MAAPTNGAPPSLPAHQFDRGLRPWMQCMGSFFLMFNSFGLINSFGVFQTFYEEHALRDQSASSIAWIGSLQSFLLAALSMVAGPAFDRGQLGPLLGAGSACVVLGTGLTGLCRTYAQLLLCQGGLVGLGTGCLMLPSMALLPHYFDKRLALAVGVASSGSAVGSICFPLLFEHLQPAIGFARTLAVMAAVMLGTLAVCVAVVRVRVRDSGAARPRRLFEARAWTEPAFSLWASFLFVSLLGLYLPSFYLQLYALQFVRKEVALYLLPVVNAGSFAGRIIPLYLADKVGAFNVEIPLTLSASAALFAWPLVRSAAGLFAFAAGYGFLLGAIVTACTPIDIAMCPSVDVVGVRMGMLNIPWALGLLLGTPIGGALQAQAGGWRGMQVFAGAALFVATLLALGARVAKYGVRVVEKC